METRNVLLAVILSSIVLIFWATFFEAPIVDQETFEKPITKNNGCNPFGSVTKFNPGQA